MENLNRAFDPERFRQQGHALVDFLADYLDSSQKGQPPKVAYPEPPDSKYQRWSSNLKRGNADILDLFKTYVHETLSLHHPHYMGHQVAVTHPISALADLVVSVKNPGGGLYEMGSASVVAERSVITWMSESLGLGPKAGGFFTSGGTLGNLTALLAARANAKTENRTKPFVILASDQAHYSIDKSANIMGLPPEAVIHVATTDALKINVDALKASYLKAKKDGFDVLAVVANACSTAAGIYDPLEEIGSFCQAEKIWFHVDGAHGAAAALSEKYRRYINGIHRADSVIWDAHKMLMAPSLGAAVIFKDRENATRTFDHKASYVLKGNPTENWFDQAHNTVELTRRDFAFKLYVVLASQGPKVFSDYVERTFDLAQEFYDLLSDQKDFEVFCKPESNIVCFRYCPAHIEVNDLDLFQNKIREAVIGSGDYYIVKTDFPSGRFLRVSLMNPFTTSQHLNGLLNALRSAGKIN